MGSVKAVEADNGIDIIAGDVKIMTIVDADATIEGITKQQMAEVYVKKMIRTKNWIKADDVTLIGM